jgi:hypothetical protein
MTNIGNVTNNMTFINTYLPDNSIQAKGNWAIKTEDAQTINNWISSDIGIINSVLKSKFDIKRNLCIKIVINYNQN